MSAIEAALRSLGPVRVRLDRDRLMYEAGRASVRPARSSPRGWVAAAACLGLVAVGEAAWLARPTPERIVERVVVVREPAALVVEPGADRLSPSPPRPLGLGLGLGRRDRLAWQVLRYGLDGLPAPSPSAGGERSLAPSRRSLREELGNVLDLGDPS